MPAGSASAIRDRLRPIVVFAAKSIVRREDMTSGDTTWYLAGTLVNFTYSIVVGVVAVGILRLLVGAG